MSGFPWWGWAIAAAALGIAELHAPGAYLIWVACGAALTAAIAGVWEPSLETQIGTFAVASLLSCLGGYFVYRRHARPHEGGPTLNARDALMIGARGVVSEPFVGGRGKVRLGDSVWLAEGPDLAVGTPITVRSVRGTLVIVEASSQMPA
jgi:inner membrane protein